MYAKRVIALTALALGLNTVGLAQAQPQPDRRDARSEQPQGQRQPERNQHREEPARPAAAHNPQAPGQRGPVARAPARQTQADVGRGAGPDHRYYRGDRLPPQYRSKQYVVDNWRAHRLSAPPRGYRWVQLGADYVLVAVATGIITQLILSQ